MIIKLDLTSLLLFIIILDTSFCFKSGLIHLVNSDYLLVNKEGIFRFKNNFDNEIIKIDSLKEEQNTSDITKNIKNIFKFKCLEDNICIFMNYYLYIFSAIGKFIKRINFSDENMKKEYVVLSSDALLKDLNTFNYIISFINDKGFFVSYFYEYNKFSEENTLLYKNEVNIFNEVKNEINIKKKDFTCQLISNSIYCFFSDTNSNEIVITKFYIDISQKKIYLSKLIKPRNNFISVTKILKSYINKDKTKILICYLTKDKINGKMKNNIILYNVIQNEFELTPEVNEFFKMINDSNMEIDLDDGINMEFFSSINKYVLYSSNEKNEILILELDEYFNIVDNKKFILDNKLNKSSFKLINFYLINDNRNYQIVLLNKNINHEKNNIGINIQFLNLDKSNRESNLRNLQSEPNNGDGSGGGDESGGGEGSGGVEGSGGEGSGGEGSGGEGSGGEGSGGEGSGGGGGPNNAHQGEREGEIGGGSFDFDNKGITISRDEVKENRDTLMSYVVPGESYELKGDDYSIKIAPMGQKEEGSTSIDFMDCENKLREYYNLSDDSVLSVFQTEVTSSNSQSLTNKVQYVVYDENNTQLNISICESEQIKISYAIKEGSDFNMTRYAFFEEKGIDILDSTDPFFNDICYTYSDGDSDVILSDRINEIYQNYSLCDSGCEYEGLNSTAGTISCTCSATDTDDSDDDDESTNLKSIILSLFSDSTFGVIQCYKRVFQDGKSSNIGFWVFLIIIIVHIPLFVQFFMKGNSNIKAYINREMEKFHYLVDQGENENINNNDNNNSKEKNISNPPKNTNEKPENNKKNIISRNVDSDLIQKSENLNLVKNTTETEGDEYKESKDIKLNQIINDEKNDFSQNDKLKLAIEQNNTNDISSKREINENNQIIAVYKTEETLGEKEIEKKDKNILNSKNSIKDSKSAYFLIQIDANNSPDSDKPLESNYILNNYEYDTAIKYESRTFWRILYIVLISKDNILNTFILKSPLESKPLQICLLIFSYTCDLALNTLFYFSDNISDKYHYTGKYLFWYTLFNNILISVISTVLSLILGGILKLMAASKDNMEEQFKEEEKKLRKDPNYKVSNERKKEILQKLEKELKKLKIKMTCFVVIDFIILLFFFYFVTAFCEIYRNTQTSWISDAVMSIIISFPIEFGIALAITIAYYLAIKYKWKFIYKIVMFLV